MTPTFHVVVHNDKMIMDGWTDKALRAGACWALAGSFAEISLLILAINLVRWVQDLPLLSKC